MKPTPPALKTRFQSLVAKIRGAVPKAMFGQVGAMIDEHMFAGTFEDQLVLRLPEAERALFVRMFGGGPFTPMKGRPMREYVAAPADVLHDDATVIAWMKRAATYARTLPPKGAKSGKTAKSGKAARPAAGRTTARPRGPAAPAKSARAKAAAKPARAKAGAKAKPVRAKSPAKPARAGAAPSRGAVPKGKKPATRGRTSR